MTKRKIMTNIKKIIYSLSIIPLLYSSLIANEKHLILAEGNSWLPMMPKNLIENHDRINKLPFSGFVMVGNTYTNEVMSPNKELNYEKVWKEVKGLKNLYQGKHNFLQININFPADFWDEKAWTQVRNNFAVVAKVARDLGFEGIVFDDEAYSNEALKMSNFKFPTKGELLKDSPLWEKRGSERNPSFDEHAYRNPKYTFKEHSMQVSLQFKEIMHSMVKEHPTLSTLVYNGPSLSHGNSNKEHTLIVDLGLPREHEHLGAIFTGLKSGLSGQATLHDMGESYRYRSDQHFSNAYQWRKYDIANDKYNNDLNASYQWIVPKEERASWSTQTQVGFMVFNQGQDSSYKEFNTLESSTAKDIQETLKKALKQSDKYVIYYCEKQHWLLENKEHPLKKEWLTMMQEVYKQVKP